MICEKEIVDVVLMATVKEVKRMCDTYEDCSDCPFGDTCYGDNISALPDNTDEIVDKWIKEHPYDCRAEKLEKNIMTELKPCPFCGEKPDDYLRAMSSAIGQMKIVMYITCRKCRIEKSIYVQGCASFERLIEAHEKLIKDWNTRAGE